MDMNEAMETIQIQKAYISSLMNQLDMLEATIRQNTVARETLEGIKDRNTGSDLLVPVGAATKIFATLADPSRVIVDIGSGVEMEMNVEDAVSHHDTLLTSLTEERTRLREKLSELERSNASLSQAVERAYAEQMRKGIHGSHGGGPKDNPFDQ